MRHYLSLLILLMAGMVAAQEKTANLNYEDADLATVVKELEAKYGQRFVYDQQLLQHALPVNASLLDATLEDAMMAVLRPQGIIAIESSKGPWALVEQCSELGLAKMLGRALQVFADSAIKLDEAKVVGDEVKVANWTRTDDERLARAIIDFMSVIMRTEYINRVIAFNYEDNDDEIEDFLSVLRRKIKSSDHQVRAGAWLDIISGRYWYKINQQPAYKQEAEELLTKGMKDEDPFVRASLLSAMVDKGALREIAMLYVDKMGQSEHAVERFAAAVLLAERSWAEPDKAQQLQNMSDDNNTAVRVAAISTAAARNITRNKNPDDFKKTVSQITNDKNPIVRAGLPVFLTMITTFDGRRHRDFIQDFGLADMLKPADAYSKFALDFIASWQKVGETGQLDDLLAAIKTTENALQSGKFSHQFLVATMSPMLAIGQIRRAPRDKQQLLMAGLMQRAMQGDNEPLIQSKTITALLDSENPWIQALGISLGSITLRPELQQFPGLVDPQAKKQAQAAYRRAAASGDELKRAPAILMSMFMAQSLRGKPLYPQLEMVLKRGARSRIMGEYIVGTMALVAALDFPLALEDLKKHLAAKDEMPPELWQLGTAVRMRALMGHNQTNKNPQEFIRLVLDQQNPKLEEMMVTTMRFRWHNLDSQARILLVEKGSIETLKLVCDRRFSGRVKDQEVNAVINRLQAVSAKAPQAAASILAELVSNHTLDQYVRAKDGKKKEIGDRFQALIKQGLSGQNIESEQIELVAQLLKQSRFFSHDRNAPFPEHLRQTALKGLPLIRKAETEEAAASLLAAVRGLENDYRPNWKLAQNPQLAEAADSAERYLLQSGQIANQVEYLTELAGHAHKRGIVLVDYLVADKVPDSMLSNAINATTSYVRKNNDARIKQYREYLLDKIRGDNEQVRSSALNVLTQVPEMHETVAKAILNKLKTNDRNVNGYFQLTNMIKRYPVGKRPDWFQLVRDHALMTLKREIALQDGNDQSYFRRYNQIRAVIQLANACGPDKEIGAFYEAAMQNSKLHANIKKEIAKGLADVAPDTKLFTEYADEAAYNALAKDIRASLATAAAQARGTAGAADFLVRAMNDEQVTNDSFAMNQICWNLKLKPTPELIAAFTKLRTQKKLQSNVDRALRKLGQKTPRNDLHRDQRKTTKPELKDEIEGLAHAVELDSIPVVSINSGKTIIAISSSAVSVIDPATGKALQTIKPTTSGIRAGACHPQFRTIAFNAGNDIAIYDGNSLTRTLKGHSKMLRGIAFSADGKQIVSCSGDRTVRIWNVETGKEEKQLKFKRGARTAIFSPNSKLLAVGGLDRKVYIIDLKTGKPRHKLAGHSFSIRSLAFSPDGKTLASGSDDMSIMLWNVESGEKKVTLTGHSSLVTALTFDQDGKQLYSASPDGSVRVWDVATGKEAKRLVDGQPGFNAIAISGKHIAVGGAGKKLLILKK